MAVIKRVGQEDFMEGNPTLKKLPQEYPQSQPEDILQYSHTLIFVTIHYFHSSTPSFTQDSKSANLADTNIRSLVDTSLGRTLAKSRRLLVVVVGTLVLLANMLDRLGASLSDGSGIAIVAVDADEVLAIGSLDIVDRDFSSTANIHFLPQLRASAQTMNTFILVFANDGVLEGGTVGKDEDGVFVAALGLAAALDAAAVGLVAAVEGAGDGLGALVGYGAFAGGDGEGGGSAGAEGAEALGGGHGEEAGEDNGGVEVHDY
ncbi:hypothetical protein KCU62_g43, partial [Aureobasidium sp. EXF-3399]